MASPFPQATYTHTPEFRDHRTGLIIFGILELLAGGLCLLMILLFFVGQSLSPKTAQAAMSWRMLMSVVVLYTGLAATFITLGIGSIMTRRWARALSLIVGWSWLAVGVVSTIVYAFVLPRLLTTIGNSGAQKMPAGTNSIIIIVALVFMAFIYIVVPGAMVLFYGNKHTKATCERRDAAVRWTDKVPLPVLGICVWLWAGVAMMLMMPFYNCVVAFFGTLVSGWQGGLLCLVFGVAWAYAAVQLYRLRMTGWWVIVVGLIVFGTSALITFSKVDMNEMYRAMGYGEAQIAQMKQFSMFQGGAMWLLIVGWIVPAIAYLIYVRRFLGKGASTPQNTGEA